MADHARYELGVDDEYNDEGDSPLELEEEMSPTGAEGRYAEHKQQQDASAEMTQITVQPATGAPSSSSSSWASSSHLDRVLLPSRIDSSSHDDHSGGGGAGLIVEPDSADHLAVLSPRVAALSEMNLSLSHQRGLFDLRGIHVAIAGCLLGITVANWVCWILSNDVNRCQLLQTFVLIVAIVTLVALVLHPLALVASRLDPNFLESDLARWLKRGGLLVFVVLLVLAVVCLQSIASGACRISTTTRQMVMIDGILLCCMWLLGLAYVVLRWRFPAWRFETAKLWSRHVKVGLLLLSFGLLTANLASLLINGTGTTAFHLTLAWSPACPAVILPSDPIQNPTQTSSLTGCQDEHGEAVDTSFCHGLPEWRNNRPSPQTVTCPLLVPSTNSNEPSPLSGVQPIWSWTMPTVSGACDEDAIIDAGYTPARPISACFSLVTRSVVDNSYCAGLADPSAAFPDTLVPPHACTDCLALYWYDLTYACVFALIFSVLLADILVGTDLEEERRAEAASPGMPVAVVIEAIPPLQASVLAKVLKAYPRVAAGAFCTAMGGLFVYSLVAFTYVLSSRCTNYLAMSIPNAMLTLNTTVFTIVFLIRHRQQVWTMDPGQNPFERVGLL